MIGSRAKLTLVLAVAALAIGIVGGAGASSRAGHCAYQVGISQTDGIATSTIHVVQDDCQLSLVSISKFPKGNAIYDTATGTFAASEVRYKMSVHLPCDMNSETDLVLGPPTLYPPQDLDYGATTFYVPCPASGRGPTGGGGGGSGGGGGGGGGGSSTSLPDLATTVHGSIATKLKLGQPLTVTVTVTNKGKAPASGVHALITLSPNAIPKLPAHASRGPGCTGVSFLDCDLGSLQTGASTTVTFGLTAQTGRKKGLFIGAQAQEIENDATLADNTGSLTLALVERSVPLRVRAIAARITAHQQLVYLSLSRAARVTAQDYIAGRARPIVWRRSLGAGTQIVRIPIPALVKGQHFSIVFRAKSGAASASTKLKLVAR